MVSRILGRLHELFDDVRRGGKVRVSHPEVDDVLPPATGGDLQLVHLGENVGGKAGDALKLMHGLCPAGKPGGG